MYYIANGVICKLGYKVGRKISHQITYDVLAAFVTDRLANDMLEEYEEARKEAMDIANTEAEDIIDDFGREKNKRSIFQYEMAEKVKHSKAETSLKRAKRFAVAMKSLIGTGKTPTVS